jgi:hypothetical protein
LPERQRQKRFLSLSQCRQNSPFFQVNSSQAVLRCEYPGRPRSVDFGNNVNVVKPAAAGREPVSRQDSGNVDGAVAQQPNSFSSSEEGVSDEGWCFLAKHFREVMKAKSCN